MLHFFSSFGVPLELGAVEDGGRVDGLKSVTCTPDKDGAKNKS